MVVFRNKHMMNQNNGGNINDIIVCDGCIGNYKITPRLASDDYRKISNIIRTKLPNLNVSRLVVQLSFPNPMKPGVKSRMKM